MNTKSNPGNGSMLRRLQSRPWLLAGSAVAAAVVLVLAFAVGSAGGPQDADGVFKVARGPLVINVTQSGTINNREKIILKSEVEGRTTILWLIPEGTNVKRGDLLVELDSSSLADQKEQQIITVQNAEAAFIRARENQAVTKSQTESDIARAELELKFAKMDYEKYLGENGEYAQALQQAEADIQIAQEELQRAQDKLTWSQRLADEGYITRTELEGDRLAANRSEISVKLSKARLELLKSYTYQRNVDQFQSDVEQATSALERVKRKAAADNIQANAELAARQSEFERQKAKLDKIDQQIAKCTIKAPVDGMVVYATTGQGNYRGNTEPLAEGQEVRERQELIHLPTTSSMMAEVKVHEASLQKVRTGMPVRVTVDALPGRTFYGRVGKIGLLPDAQSVWLNPDLKVYSTEIHLDGDGSELRPGMNCRAEIIVEQYPEALYVPVQSVVRRDGKTVVYLPGGERPQPREVKVGLDNNRMIHILDGLAAGDEVLLAPPLAPSAISEQQHVLPASMPAYAPAQEAPTAQPAGPDGMSDPQEMRRRLEEMTPEQRQEMLRRLRESGGQGEAGGMRPGGPGAGEGGGGRRRAPGGEGGAPRP